MCGNGQTLLICCGAIAREVLAIINANNLDHMKVESLPAGLHNTPQLIPERVRKKIKDQSLEIKIKH